MYTNDIVLLEEGLLKTSSKQKQENAKLVFFFWLKVFRSFNIHLILFKISIDVNKGLCVTSFYKQGIIFESITHCYLCKGIWSPLMTGI